MKNKKIIFFRVIIGLTAIAAIVAPVAAVVSCSEDFEDEFTIKEKEIHSGASVLTGGKSDNVWEVTLHKDSVSEEHSVKLLSDKLWLAVSKNFSIGYEINVVKDNNKILTFTVLAPKSTTYSALFLKDDIKSKLDEAIKNTNGAQAYFDK